jgi:signal transduction histidine kinase
MNEMFAAVLGHDLRSPLSAILTAARVLERVSSEAIVHETAVRIASSGSRMNRMIADLLDMARVRLGGGLPIAPADCDLDAIVRRSIDEYTGDRHDAKIECVPTGETRGRWDADRIAQLASNLIGNAIEHGRHGGGIVVRLDGTAPDVVTLSVTNPGAIDPALVDGIFDPFSTGRRDHGPGQGLGLGLYIARQIVEAHGGTIAVAAAPDATTFDVSLPRRGAAS